MAERIALAERLDTVGATALAAEISKVPASGHIILDGQAVSHFGAQAAQVILSAAKTFKAGGGNIECVDVNDRASEQLAAIGLSATQLTEVAE